MKKILTILAVLVVLTSCYKINPWMDRKFYDGVWTIEKKVITQFDETGNHSAQDEFEMEGELVLRKDSLFFSSSINEIPNAGRWTVNRVGKGDIIYIWDDPQSTGPICDRKVTVSNKSSKKMTLQFIQIDTEGKIEFKTEYFLVYKEKVNYDDPPTQPVTKGFKYTDKTGKQVIIPLTKVDVVDDTYIPSGGGNPIACKKVTLEFFHTNENNIYQAIKIIFNTDDDGEYTGNYPYQFTGGNRILSMTFWDGGNTTSFINLIQDGSTSLNITEIDTASGVKTVKGTWSEILFNNIPQSLNEAKMTNVEIDAIL
jgi:hypothetical protein